MPPAVRKGDPDIPHCSPMVRADGAKTVFVNGRPWSCQGHINTLHAGNSCSPHAMPIAVGSATVRVEGRGAGRSGDYITACTACGKGSINVFAGG